MSKEELKNQLDEAGIKYDGRWSEEKLQAALDGTSETPEKPAEELSEPVEEVESSDEDETTGEYIVVTRIKQNGTVYEPGNVFTGEPTERLLEAGAIKQ